MQRKREAEADPEQGMERDKCRHRVAGSAEEGVRKREGTKAGSNDLSGAMNMGMRQFGRGRDSGSIK